MEQEPATLDAAKILTAGQKPGEKRCLKVMRFAVVVGVVLGSTALLGCDKTTADTASPNAAQSAAPPGSTKHEVPSSGSAGDLEFAYTSKDKDEADPAASEKTEAQTPDFDPDALRKIAKTKAEEVVDRYSPMIMTPALPTAWPSVERKVQYIVYPLIPQQSVLELVEHPERADATSP